MIERARYELSTAVRSLFSTPGPTLAAVVTLAVAAGVNLAMFGLIDRALLSPPALVIDAGRVFTLSFQATDDPASGRMTTTSYVTYAAVRDQVPAWSGAAAFQRNPTSVVVEGEQRRVVAMLVSGQYFDVIGVRPALGPGIHAIHDDAGAPPVAVLSHAFWRSAFGGHRDVIGRRLFLRGLEYTVGGVMPSGFSGHSAADVDLWVPFAAAMRASPGWDQDSFRNILSIVVRLAPGVAVEAAETQAGAAVGRRVRLSGIAGAAVAATEQRVAWWLGGVSLLVFVIGLANAGTLLVVRAARRRHDLAIRAAIGASRGRLVIHSVVEASLLAVAATLLSLLLAPWLDNVVRRVLFPGLVAIGHIDARTVATAAIAGLFALLVAAMANLWQLPRESAAQDIAAAGRAGPRRKKALTALLLVQTTLSVMLLAGAAMFGTSFYRLAAQDFGMRMDGVVVAEFELGPGSPPGSGRLLEEAIDQVRALPHVQLVSPIDAIPFGGFHVPPISVPGRPRPNVGGQLPHLIAATPELFKILRIDIVEGRAFTETDGRGAPVVIVNQAMARGVWPGETALGKCIRIGFDPDFDPMTSAGPPTPSAKVPCREVIGVTRDVRQRSLLPVDNEARLMQYFVPMAQVPSPPFAPQSGLPVRGLMIRTDARAETLAPAIRRLIVGDRRDLPFLSVQPYMQLLDRQMRPWQLGTTLLALFSALAVAVAAVGLYAAFAHAVAERRREMAIRLAMGARPANVTRMILREALVLAGAGVGCGLMAAILAGRGVQSLLYGTTPSDPLVLASAAIVMLLVAAAATLLPARAAAGADPNSLLRVSVRCSEVRFRGSGVPRFGFRGVQNLGTELRNLGTPEPRNPVEYFRAARPISRRQFGALAGAMVAPIAFGDACQLAVEQGIGRDGRIAARPKSGVTTSAEGTRPLGLDASRDAILQIPANAGSTPLPLLVLLHGAGGGGQRQLQRISGAVEAAGIAVLAPDSRGPTWDAIRGDFGRDVAFLNRALERVFDTVAVDPARVAVGGFSDGATYALSLGLVNGDLFPRIVAFSPGFVVEGAPHGKPRVFVSHGTSDPILPIDQCSRVIVPALKRHGYDVTFREFTGGHEVPAAIAAEAMAWIKS